nr:MobP3 family relaxase [Enterocloster clostridioformis]
MFCQAYRKGGLIIPKIIFTSRYMRDAPAAQLENYVRYIATREGAEKIDESKRNLPATKNQQKLIRQLIRDIPSSKEMLEYTDFLLQPTSGNASEFISCALEQNLDLAAKRENYVDYIANRPRVDRIGEHGLFTDAGKPVVISRVQKEVTDHKGPVWTHVVSLRREDAARLGYDNAEQWMALLRSKRAMLCRYMKIGSENLRWYAAFHNESHHPHVHLMVYSAKDNDGFLTEKSIEAMRSELAHDIFRQDFAHIYERQNQARADVKTGTADVLRELMEALRSGTLVSPEIETQMVQLLKRLQNTKGKKVYGYLKRDVKDLIDRIVEELAKDSRVAALYQAWGRWNDEIVLTYQKEAPPLPPLSKQPQFKSIKNMVIAEAIKLGGHQFTFEDEEMPEPAELSGEMLPEGTDIEETIPEQHEQGSLTVGRNYRGRSGQNWWNHNYKQARQYLYSFEKDGQDFAEAFRLFLKEAESGNALAMHDLGRMFADGLGREIDKERSEEWYAKALAAFRAAEQTEEERQRPYLQYRIGKMYAAGLGTEKCYESAAQWFSKAADSKHKYAQYSLAGLYSRGKGVELDNSRAFFLYQCSANQGNPYASYELAKMYRDGIGTEKDIPSARQHFENAFSGFLALERDSHDDKLQYRLGQMLHTGTGTERDDTAAADYWQRSARLGNVNAQYALGKLWLENGNGDPQQAVEWITKAAESGNAAAQYDLGKIYLTGEDVSKDVDTAICWLSQSAEKGNPFAQYALGKLYLCGHDVPRDREKAIPLLTASAEQGNIYAQFLLDHLDSFRDPSIFLAATRLMHRLENLFREDYRKAAGASPFHIDRKRRRRLAEKKQAQGHKRDDQEQAGQHTYG